jgi:methionyl-tRNA synthetase
LFSVFRAISFCENKLNGIVNDVSKLTNELDRTFIAQINNELNSYLDAMEKTKFDLRLVFI